jgi:hypothetical protein
VQHAQHARMHPRHSALCVPPSTQADSSGKVSVAKLQKILTEFQLEVDVTEILQDESKTDLSFEEFKTMLG